MLLLPKSYWSSPTRVVLIDGRELAEYMLDLDLGVTTPPPQQTFDDDIPF
jgi:restriction endonuclease Mrr